MNSDVFGADGISTEGNPAPAAAPAAPVGGTMTAVATVPVAAAPAAGVPSVEQATAKAVAKADADNKVATDPHVVHGTVTAASSPKSLGSTGAGAVAGFLLGGPPGAALGAAIGFVAERYGIGGGPSTWLQKAKDAAHKIAKK